MIGNILQTLLPGVTAFLGAWLAHRFVLRQAEHQTRFQRQYERRDEVIATTWRLLLEANNRFYNWSSPFGSEDDPSKAEQGKDVYGAIRELTSYYRSHMLWFDQRTLDELNRFMDDLSKRFHALYDAFENDHHAHAQWTERFEARREAWKWAREGLQEGIHELEGEFRRALGIDRHPWWRRLLNPDKKHLPPGG